LRCFYHPEAEAIGVCRNCGKGLCGGCAVDLGDGLACRDRCEAKAQALINYSNASLAWRSNSLVSAILLALIGIGVLIYGAFVEVGADPPVFVLAVMGAFLLAWAILITVGPS
jgi:hypothetical protein